MAKAATSPETTVGTNKYGSPQVRTIRKDGWTVRARAAFLDHLAATCNISLSARAVGKDPSSVRALRRRDAEFAAAWDDALETGYATVEAMLLSRAVGTQAATDAVDPAILPDPPKPEDMDSELALRLLSLKNKNGQPLNRRKPFKRVSNDEVDAELLKRLKALHRRMVKEGRNAAGLGQD